MIIFFILKSLYCNTHYIIRNVNINNIKKQSSIQIEFINKFVILATI